MIFSWVILSFQSLLRKKEYNGYLNGDKPFRNREQHFVGNASCQRSRTDLLLQHNAMCSSPTHSMDPEELHTPYKRK